MSKLFKEFELRIKLKIMSINTYFFPSNAFLRLRRKKALLRVNDRGGVWRMCILALCRACVCVRVFCTCVRAPLSNLSCARNSLYIRTMFVQCVYSVHRARALRRRKMHVSK